MNTTVYLQKQFANLNGVFHGIVEDLTDAEWVTRPAPGSNLIGYTVWHLPRTQDTFVQTWIRGVTEVAHHDRWSIWEPLKRFGTGIGVSLADADHIAHTVKKADVLAYADDVQQTIQGWLQASHDSDLDQIFETRQRLAAYPAYHTPGFADDVASLYDQPVWALLIRPCMGHIHRHLGELELAKRLLRAGVNA